MTARAASDTALAVRGDRLWKSLMELATIGSYDDEQTGLRGVSRLALTEADAAARRLVMTWFRNAGLSIHTDRIGNVFARREGHKPHAAPVMVGSHLDTVATAGAFDGCLGVLGALEVIRTLNDHNITTGRPIDVVIFTEEEGARFGTDMLGSAVAAGRIRLEDAYGLTDGEGTSVADALGATGFIGHASAHLKPPHAYLECHIEQGPVLARRKTQIGVVTGVQAISWQGVTIRGRAAHAGTTPTELRADAGLAAAQVVVELRSMVNSGDFGELRATVGRLRLYPGLTNIVPMLAEMTVDLRNPDDHALERAEAHLARVLEAIEEGQPGLSFYARRLARTRHVPFDPSIQRLLQDVSDSYGLSHRPILSGAGHDAQEMAAICPTGMIFVPGEYDGISHNPREYSTPEACTAGINVLAGALLRLAR